MQKCKLAHWSWILAHAKITADNTHCRKPWCWFPSLSVQQQQELRILVGGLFIFGLIGYFLAILSHPESSWIVCNYLEPWKIQKRMLCRARGIRVKNQNKIGPNKKIIGKDFHPQNYQKVSSNWTILPSSSLVMQNQYFFGANEA